MVKAKLKNVFIWNALILLRPKVNDVKAYFYFRIERICTKDIHTKPTGTSGYKSHRSTRTLQDHDTALRIFMEKQKIIN